MKEEPFFIVNDYVEDNRKELEKIISIVKPENIKHYERAVLLRNLTNEMFKTYVNKRKFTNRTKEKEDVNQKKKELEQKKLELLKKLKQLELEKKIKSQTPEEKEDIIISKFTNKALATATFDGFKYIIKEPELTEEYKKLMKEIKTEEYYNINNFIQKTK